MYVRVKSSATEPHIFRGGKLVRRVIKRAQTRAENRAKKICN